MKKKIPLLLCILLFVLCACKVAVNEASINEQQSSDFSATVDYSEVSNSPSTSEVYNIRINDIGIPLINRYAQTENTVIPWDIIVYQGNLFVGSRDLSFNSGPIDLWCYNVETNEWNTSYTLPEEEASRFYVIDGFLTVPGLDAQEDWEFANFYRYNGTNWAKKRTITNASHCFDLVSQGGKQFAAIEYEGEPSSHYIAVSGDNGDTFDIIPLLKNGAKVKKENWLQDVFVIEDNVCALCEKELYVYDGENFIYETSWNNYLQSRGYRRYLIQSKAYHNGTLYFTTGNLYKCGSSYALEKVVSPDDAVVQDIYVYDDSMYLLCISRNETEYVMTVYLYDGEFTEVFAFTNDAMAVSFAVYGNKFFFGMGSKNKNNKNNGRILEIEMFY